ncbi:MAG: hypothetical protein ABIF09_09360, partial [Gemmatimonadota bacterium]
SRAAMGYPDSTSQPARPSNVVRWNSNDPVYVENLPIQEGQLSPIRRFNWVGENYVEAMQIPVVAIRYE